MARFKVCVSDYDYGDLAIERRSSSRSGRRSWPCSAVPARGSRSLPPTADAIIKQYARIPRETIARLKRCKVICRYGVGVDIVDVEAANEHGILVTNVPDYCTRRGGRSHHRARLHAHTPHPALRGGGTRRSLALERRRRAGVSVSGSRLGADRFRPDRPEHDPQAARVRRRDRRLRSLCLGELHEDLGRDQAHVRRGARAGPTRLRHVPL